jgi:hypothetical protein
VAIEGDCKKIRHGEQKFSGAACDNGLGGKKRERLLRATIRSTQGANSQAWLDKTNFCLPKARIRFFGGSGGRIRTADTRNYDAEVPQLF